MSVRKRIWSTNGVEKTAWQADYVDGNGERQRKSFKLKKDAEAFLLTAKGEVRDGVHVPDSATITVEEAGKLWLKSGAAADLERTTLDQRRQHLNLHIVPLIGKDKLNKITVPSVRAFQDTLRDNGRSPAMVKRVTVSLGSVLADAQLRGQSIRNAVHEMSRAKSSRAKVEKRQQKRIEVGVDIPTNDEIRAIIGAAQGRWRPLLITAIFTGLRASELHGLRWSDVDTGQRDDEGQPILAAKYSGLHALRHWFASWCINRKSDGGLELTPKAVQERMGHSNIAVTMDTYSHLFPVADEQEALAAAERAFLGT